MPLSPLEVPSRRTPTGPAVVGMQTFLQTDLVTAKLAICLIQQATECAHNWQWQQQHDLVIRWSWVIRRKLAVNSRYLHLIWSGSGTYTCFSAAMMVCAGSWCEPELPGDLHHNHWMRHATCAPHQIDWWWLGIWALWECCYRPVTAGARQKTGARKSLVFLLKAWRVWCLVMQHSLTSGNYGKCQKAKTVWWCVCVLMYIMRHVCHTAVPDVNVWAMCAWSVIASLLSRPEWNKVELFEGR